MSNVRCMRRMSDIKHCTSWPPYHLLPTQLTRVWCHKSKSLGWLWKHGAAFIGPNVIDILTPSELSTKVKLTLLSSISTAQDALVSEVTSLLTEDYFTKSQCIPNTASKLLEKARASVASINNLAINYQCKKMFQGTELRRTMIN